MVASFLVAVIVSAVSPNRPLPVPIPFQPVQMQMANDNDALVGATPEATNCTLECVVGRKPPCICVPNPPAAQPGTVTPSFYILSVYYTPPGNMSSVNYTASTVLGSTTSSTDTYKNTVSVTASIGFSFFGLGGSVSVSGSRAYGTTQMDEVDVLATQNNGYQFFADTDVIDHDNDEIWFIMTPLVDLQYTPQSAFGPAKVTWMFDNNQPMSSLMYYVYVGWLKNPATMPTTVANVLSAHGITPTQYAQLLKADPFAYSYTFGQTIDPNRFQLVTTSPGALPFIPVQHQGDKPSQTTYGLTRSTTTSQTSSSEVDYTASVTASTSFFASISVTDAYAWTATTSEKDSTGTTTGEALVMWQPAFGYSGPTLVRVYVDKIWKTFFFSQDYN
jgi:hypothetical protein